MQEVIAGGSAARAARQARAEAEAYRRLAAERTALSRRFEAASVSERRVAGLLGAMESLGWHVLADRRWPGTRSGNVDLLLVGPGGVLVVDVKNWAQPSIVGGRLLRGQADAQDDVDKLLAVTDLVEQSVEALGLAPAHVHPVLVFAGVSVSTRIGRVTASGEREVVPWINRLGSVLVPSEVDALADVLATDFPPYEVEDTPVTTTTLPVVVPRTRQEATDEQLTLPSLEEIEASLLERASAAPIEEWMTFLHPGQVRVVRQRRRGPSRLRGPAGTGKTVIGLHRAAHLAGRGRGDVLFVSYLRTLPGVLEGLFARLAPDHVDRVEFSGLHRWARTFLTGRGVAHRVDETTARTLFNRMWLAGGRDALGGIEGPDYWWDEIRKVIKGRGLTEFEEYRALQRVGRSTRLTTAQRELVWDLYEAYTAALRERDVMDFDDLLLLALAELRARPLDRPYAAVIVDEVQDLSRVGVQLLHALAGDGPDAFTLIGDGQQAIYPGGFTLAEAGIDIRGRSTVLDVNYRNCAAILEAALEAVDSEEYVDLDDSVEQGRRSLDTARPGGRVDRVEAADRRSLDTALTSALEGLVGDGARPGDCAVLTGTTAQANRVTGVLRRAGWAVESLEDYAGRSSDRVKIGTIKRSKGLEFRAVLLPEPYDVAPPRGAHESEEAHRERCGLRRRELFVGMTRARDHLWLGYLRG